MKRNKVIVKKGARDIIKWRCYVCNDRISEHKVLLKTKTQGIGYFRLCTNCLIKCFKVVSLLQPETVSYAFSLVENKLEI